VDLVNVAILKTDFMQIRTLQKHELPLLFHYSSLENWDNEELHSTTLFNTHPNDFFVAFKNKQILGFIIAIKHSNEFGFVSNFLVLKKFRGLGHGKEIFAFALKHLSGCQIALDSVLSKEDIYKKAGFKSYFDVVNYRFIIGSVTLPQANFELIDFNKELSLKDKDLYMKKMILSDKTRYKAIKTHNRISSFALSFEYIDGYKIHLESEDINEALTLFFALTNVYKSGTAIYLQSSPLSPLLEAIVELLKMQVHSTYRRMYNFLR
jgi:GNAT superfamily N-acetyltransferase